MTQGQTVGKGRRFTGEIGVREKVYKKHVSAPGLLHLSREFQKTPEKFEIPASDWSAEIFFLANQQRATRTLSYLLTRSCFRYGFPHRVPFVQRADQIYHEIRTFFI